jgi:hypothetical protein
MRRRSRAAIHYAPGENLEHIDVALIDRAEREIDMAAYVLRLIPHGAAWLLAIAPSAGARFIPS